MHTAMAADQNVQTAVEKTVLKATKVIEDQLDAEIEKLDKLDDDELDRLR